MHNNALFSVICTFIGLGLLFTAFITEPWLLGFLSVIVLVMALGGSN